ncbi:MAG: glycogen synthase [Endomicrobia bacterium]|nr:glycogen synthase [Endomicrobiia bacterium]
MKVLFASFECAPFAKVGGLADVVGTLPKYLTLNKNIEVKIVIPLHSKIDKEFFKLDNTGLKVIIPIMDEYIEGMIWKGKLNKNVEVYFIQNERFFNRDEIYATSHGDYPDNHLRFIFFSRAVLETAKAIDFKPDIIHCHDMQSGLIPAYLKTLYRIDAFYYNTKTVFTIHNIAYQGLYGPEVHFIAGFSGYDFIPEKLEYYGKINFMKAGITFADYVTTVSPTYARMISSLHHEGRGLEGILAKRFAEGKLIGIINGIDYVEWDPVADEFIKANYDLNNLQNKKLCKEDLQEYCKFVRNNVPIYGMVSRIDPLKGFDLILKIMDKFLSNFDVQVVILGKGYKHIQDDLKKIENHYSNKFKVFLEFNNPLAHKIYAGSDFFLMPSNSEPCGLGQMVAMRYGTIPIVYKTGGLADTVKNFDKHSGSGNGLVFDHYSEEYLYEKLTESFRIYNENSILPLIRNAMSENFSWEESTKRYIELYNRLVGIKDLHKEKIKFKTSKSSKKLK